MPSLVRGPAARCLRFPAAAAVRPRVRAPERCRRWPFVFFVAAAVRPPCPLLPSSRAAASGGSLVAAADRPAVRSSKLHRSSPLAFLRVSAPPREKSLFLPLPSECRRGQSPLLTQAAGAWACLSPWADATASRTLDTAGRMTGLTVEGTACGWASVPAGTEPLAGARGSGWARRHLRQPGSSPRGVGVGIGIDLPPPGPSSPSSGAPSSCEAGAKGRRSSIR